MNVTRVVTLPILTSCLLTVCRLSVWFVSIYPQPCSVDSSSCPLSLLLLVLSVLLCLVCVCWSGIGFTTLASPFPDCNLYYILDGQHKFLAAELLGEERERAGVAQAALPE